MPRTLITAVPFCKKWDDGCYTLEDVRGSYPHLVTPWAKNPAAESLKFSISGLMPKTTHKAAFEMLKGSIDDLINEKQKTKIKGLPPDKKFLRRGDDKIQNPEYHGHWYVAVSNTQDRPPTLRTASGRLITGPEAAKLFKAGHNVDILLRPWFQDSTEWGQRVNANLIAVRYRRPNDEFGESEVDDDGAFEVSDDDGDNGFDQDGDADGL